MEANEGDFIWILMVDTGTKSIKNGSKTIGLTRREIPRKSRTVKKHEENVWYQLNVRYIHEFRNTQHYKNRFTKLMSFGIN